VRSLAGRARAVGRRRSGVLGAVPAAVEREPALTGSIAVVLVAGILLAVVGEQPAETRHENAPAVPATPVVATIGPAPGAQVAGYLRTAADDLQSLVTGGTGDPTYAVVDLRRALTPQRVRAAFRGTAVVRAYLQVRSTPSTQVRSVPLQSLDGLVEGMGQVAQVAKATASSYTALLQSFHPRTNADREARHRYLAARRAALVEARRLRRPRACSCVFALVVRATPAGLTELQRRPIVRVVDPAPPTVPLTALTVRPLEPSSTDVVPRPSLPGG
jgi:hypothetical protein